VRLIRVLLRGAISELGFLNRRLESCQGYQGSQILVILGVTFWLVHNLDSAGPVSSNRRLLELATLKYGKFRYLI
jgi:hypothetical protein